MLAIRKSVFLWALVLLGISECSVWVAAQGAKLLPPTRPDIEGPYYRPGAPYRSKLQEKGDKGPLLIFTGSVVNQQGQPLAGALVDIWQANADGRYDNDDPDRPPPKDLFRFRGKIVADKEGKFRFETVRPGHYQIGPKDFRPGHIHFKLSQPGYKKLTTQVYFKGDPYNKFDQFYHPDNEVAPEKQGEVYQASFRFVLVKE